jgi:hypothetical protein
LRETITRRRLMQPAPIPRCRAEPAADGVPEEQRRSERVILGSCASAAAPITASSTPAISQLLSRASLLSARDHQPSRNRRDSDAHRVEAQSGRIMDAVLSCPAVPCKKRRTRRGFNPPGPYVDRSVQSLGALWSDQCLSILQRPELCLCLCRTRQTASLRRPQPCRRPASRFRRKTKSNSQ